MSDKGMLTESVYLVHERIWRHAGSLADFNISNFYDPNKLSEHNNLKGFEARRRAIERVIDIAKQVFKAERENVVKLPMEILFEMERSLEKIISVLREMRNFYDEEAVRDSHGAWNGVTYDSERKRLIESFDLRSEEYEKAFVYFANMNLRVEMNAAVEQLNKLTDEKTYHAIVKHSGLYQKNEERHDESARRWLVGGVCLTVFTFCFGVWSMFDLKHMMSQGVSMSSEAWFSLALMRILDLEHMMSRGVSMSSEAWFSLTLMRIFIFGLLVSLVFWVLKNYSLNKHNQLMNKQKSLALQTFEEFSKASVTDIEMRRIVLGKVTATIFDTGDMGYVENKRPPEKDSDVASTLLSLILKKGDG